MKKPKEAMESSEEESEEEEKPKKKAELTEKQKADDHDLLNRGVNKALISIKPNLTANAKLGEGGFGKVYLSEDENYAIKVVPLEDKKEDGEVITVAEIIHDTLQETKVMDMVGNYVDIVKYYGYTLGTYKDPENPFAKNKKPVESIQVFLEPLKGDTLDHFIQRKQYNADGTEKKLYQPLTTQQVILLTYKVLQALVHIHESGVIHGDIKPSNLFLTDDGQVKVIDFGGAQIVGDEEFINEVFSKGYCPPEYQDDENTEELVKDAHYDLYSLGVTIRELLTGSKVPTKPTAQQQGDPLLLQMLEFSDSLRDKDEDGDPIISSALEALDKFEEGLAGEAEDTKMPTNFRKKD